MTMTLSLLMLSLVTSTRSVLNSGTIALQQVQSQPLKPAPVRSIVRLPLQSPTSQRAIFNPSTRIRSLATESPTLILNGQRYSVPWIQTQTAQGPRIAMADGAFRQLTGAQFLSTDRLDVQPIDWFGSLIPLPTLLGSPIDRYLDITDWAKTAGWQMQIPSNATNAANALATPLMITTPTAQVSQLIQQSSPAVDRIVIQLDRPATYQVDAQSKEWVMTVDAALSPNVVQQFKPSPSRRIAALKLESDPQGTKTILRLGIPITSRPVISTQSNPAQITIDVGIPDSRDLSILWKPGILWRQQVMTVGSHPLTVLWFELDPTLVRFRPVIPTTLPDLAGTAPLYQTAQQSQTLLAMNGGFFNRINQLPLGMIQTDGVLRSGPILNRGVMAWDDTGNVRFDRYSLQETATIAAQSIPLTALNSAYVQAGVARYTPAWGNQYKTLSDNEVVMTVMGDRSNGTITEQKSMAVAGELFPIPSGGYLLTVRSNRTLAATIAPGSAVQVRTSETPNGISAFPQVLGGGPLLIQNRQMVLDAVGEKFSPAFAKERAARSAMGRTPSGKLLMVSVHNTIGMPGASLSDLAQIMQQLGAVDALNFDGGSSTTLHLGGVGGQVIDRPSRSGARVHNAIGVFSK